jgi:hypothetical protein
LYEEKLHRFEMRKLLALCSTWRQGEVGLVQITKDTENKRPEEMFKVHPQIKKYIYLQLDILF